MKPVHTDVRHLILRHYKLYQNIKQTCDTFQISRSSLWRFRKLEELNQSLEPIKKRQPKRFTAIHEEFIMENVTKQPHLGLMYLTRRFKKRFQISISVRTIRRILKRNNWSYRKLTYRYMKKSSPTPSFTNRIKGIPIERILSLDEMGFGHGFIHPKKSWCPKNSENKVRKIPTRFVSRPKSVICLTSCDRVVNYTWSYSAINTATLLEFLMVSLHGYAGYYIILDNVAFHKSHRVHKLFQDFGVTPIFIDPYCPYQNPIEEVFANVKHKIRQCCPTKAYRFDKTLRQAMIQQKRHTLRQYFMRSTST